MSHSPGSVARIMRRFSFSAMIGGMGPRGHALHALDGSLRHPLALLARQVARAAQLVVKSVEVDQQALVSGRVEPLISVSPCGAQ